MIIKHSIVCMILLCVGNVVLCMDKQERGRQVFNAFVNAASDNGAIIYSIAKGCFQKQKSPFLSRHKFMNYFRPASINGHERAAIFPIPIIDKIWHRYVAELIKSQCYDIYSDVAIGLDAYGHITYSLNPESWCGLLGYLCKSICNLFGADYKVSDQYDIMRCDVDSPMPVVEWLTAFTQALEKQFANGDDGVAMIEYNNMLEIIFANHDPAIVFLLSHVNVYHLRDKEQILNAIHDALEHGRVGEFHSINEAINAIQQAHELY